MIVLTGRPMGEWGLTGDQVAPFFGNFFYQTWREKTNPREHIDIQMIVLTGRSMVDRGGIREIPFFGIFFIRLRNKKVPKDSFKETKERCIDIQMTVLTGHPMGDRHGNK